MEREYTHTHTHLPVKSRRTNSMYFWGYYLRGFGIAEGTPMFLYYTSCRKLPASQLLRLAEDSDWSELMWLNQGQKLTLAIALRQRPVRDVSVLTLSCYSVRKFCLCFNHDSIRSTSAVHVVNRQCAISEMTTVIVKLCFK